MECEINLNIHILNGENWSKTGDKNILFKDYESSNFDSLFYL